MSGSNALGLSALAGNAPLKRQLSAQAQSRGLSHAYLISGPSGSGKHTLARLIAAAMVCSGEGELPCGTCPACKKALQGIHPDVITAGEGGKAISVGQARLLRADAYIRPNEAPRKVYILPNAQDMNASAQNALLKLLEEGPTYAAFLLLAENPGGVLTTIRSRCESLSLGPVSPSEAREYLRSRFPQLPPEQLHQAAQTCGGLLGQAVEALEHSDSDPSACREAARRLLELMTAGNELELAAWCVCLEKWDREALSQMLAQAIALLRDALALEAGGRTLSAGGEEDSLLQATTALGRKRLLRCVDLLETLTSHAAFNVNAGHLCGALAAGINGGTL